MLGARPPRARRAIGPGPAAARPGAARPCKSNSRPRGLHPLLCVWRAAWYSRTCTRRVARAAVEACAWAGARVGAPRGGVVARRFCRGWRGGRQQEWGQRRLMCGMGGGQYQGETWWGGRTPRARRAPGGCGWGAGRAGERAGRPTRWGPGAAAEPVCGGSLTGAAAQSTRAQAAPAGAAARPRTMKAHRRKGRKLGLAAAAAADGPGRALTRRPRPAPRARPRARARP